jgi:hypothetical protein
LLLVVIGCYWLLLVVIGCYWLLLVVAFGNEGNRANAPFGPGGPISTQVIGLQQDVKAAAVPRCFQWISKGCGSPPLSQRD